MQTLVIGLSVSTSSDYLSDSIWDWISTFVNFWDSIMCNFHNRAASKHVSCSLPWIVSCQGMISDIIRYIISWLGPFFAFAQSVFVIVDVQVGVRPPLMTCWRQRNVWFQLLQEKNSVCANALPSDQLNQACEVSVHPNDLSKRSTSIDSKYIFYSAHQPANPHW